MRQPQGYAVLFAPDQQQKEWDTVTCGHCQRIFHTKPLEDPADAGGLCKCCMRLICSECVDKGVCTPWQVAFERAEARQRFLQSAGL